MYGRRRTGLPDSRKRYQEVRRSVARAVYAGGKKLFTSKPAVGALLAAPFKSERVRKAVMSGKSRLVSKLGYKKQSAVPVSSVQEGQSVVIRKPISLNLGGKGQIRNMPAYVKPLYNRCMHNYISSARAIGTNIIGGQVISSINDGALPLICYDLTFNGSLTDTSDAFFCGQLQQNGTWTNLAQTPVLKAIESGSTQTDTIRRTTTWLHHYVKIRMMMYGRSKSNTLYKIIFFRCSDEEHAPNRTDVNFERDEINVNEWFPLVSKYTTNPVNIGFNDTRFKLRGKNGKKIQILKSFDYNIGETLSTEESGSVRKLAVAFNVSLNKIKQHLESNVDSTYQTDITAIAPQSGVVINQNGTKTCLPEQRVYMAVLASQYDTAGELNYEACSYDINMQQYASAAQTIGWPV